ncbi:MAG TPA: hypothetical protein VHD76_15685 [Bryobacteraceae bacterium]|nr:hypothetical protein [Bryobacteraceae bacterium]
MTAPFIFFPWLSGLVFLILGLFAARKRLSLREGSLASLGRVFVAAPLAVFGAEHIAGAQFVMQIVPPWMPGRLFWTYFVGCALFATSLSFISGRYLRESSALFGLMIFSFVLLLHLPKAVANPGDRFAWIVAIRDSSFALGAWSLTGSQIGRGSPVTGHRLVSVCRILLALIFLFFGIEHLIFPQFAPGVPLSKLTPAWIPAASLWGYLTGLALLSAGAALLLSWRERTAALYLGLWMALLVAFLYLPMLAAAKLPSEMTEAINYAGDTLLFGGVILLLAEALGTESPTPTGLDRPPESTPRSDERA